MEMNETNRKKKTKFILAGTIVVVLIVGGIIYWALAQRFETTDNAQIDCNIVPIRSVVSATLDSINFTDNAFVKKGQILFVFDTTELKARVEEALATLEIAKSKLKSAKNRAQASADNAVAGDFSIAVNDQSITAAKAELDNAQHTYDRISTLYRIKGTTLEQLQTAETNLAIAKANYGKGVSLKESSALTTSGLKSLAESEKNQIVLAVSQVKQCEADLILARRQLRYGTIFAPCYGIVSKRMVQQGQYIPAMQSLCALVENSTLWITANFKETQIHRLKIGQEVKITVDACPGLILFGRIDSFSGATGAKYSLLPPDNATGNFIKITQRVPVKISIDRLPKDAGRLLLPGMSVFVKVKIS